VHTMVCSTFALFVWLISHQPAVFFSQNKPATNNQSTVLFSQNKPAPANRTGWLLCMVSLEDLITIHMVYECIPSLIDDDLCTHGISRDLATRSKRLQESRSSHRMRPCFLRVIYYTSYKLIIEL
jgi:hypothetical protein